MRHASIAFLLAIAGCSGGRGVALVHVTGHAKGIDHFSVDATVGGQSSKGNVIAPPQHPFYIPPEQTFSLGFDPDHVGSVMLTVNALGATGTIASGSTMFSIEAGQSVDVTVDLGGGTGGDMAMPRDGGVLPDIGPAGPDLLPPTLQLASGESDPNQLVLDPIKSQLYWNNFQEGSIRRMGTDGNGRVFVGKGESGPIALAVDGQAVYWANANGSAIRVLQFANPSPNDLIAGIPSPIGVAGDGKSVYFTTNGPALLDAFNLGSGGSGTLYTKMAHTFGPVLSAGNRLVFSDSDPMVPPGNVVSTALDGTNYQLVAPGYADYLVFDSARGDVYFSDTKAGIVWFLDASSAMATMVAQGLDQPAGVAIDDMYLYWINYGDGALYRTPLRNSDPTAQTTINGGQVTAGALVSDGNYLYWTIRGNQMGTGSVMRMLKP